MEKNEDLMKKVDEAWKEEAKKAPEEAPDALPPEASFGLFITGLMMEAMIALGEAEHPVTKKKELNTGHAKFIIDTLSMLETKTKGNLAKEEADMFSSILYELRMRFVGKLKV